MKIQPHVFDAGSLSMMRRMRGDTPAAGESVHAVQPQSMGATIVAALESTHAAVRRALASYRVYRDARDTARALRGLDDRTLHDLGYHRSEIDSVAIESSVARAR